MAKKSVLSYLQIVGKTHSKKIHKQVQKLIKNRQKSVAKPSKNVIKAI